MYALDMGLMLVRFGHRAGYVVGTYLRLSSSFLIMHSLPDLLHCVHSVLPSGTTHLILLSRHEAQAIEARCLTCPFLDDRELWPNVEQ